MCRFINLFIGILFVMLFACTSQRNTLLVSKDHNQNIKNWLLDLNKKLIIKECYFLSKDSILFYLNNVEGIILGGGEDVNPLLYNKPDYKVLCEIPDNFRDSLEVELITFAMKNNIPILGICRGNQILNVANGGTLIPDIPTFYKNSDIIHRSKNDKAHLIIPFKNSWLKPKIRRKTYWVNSRHHQSIDEVAETFKIAAISPDSVIESIELNDNHTHPFAIAVQWHPESITKDKLSKFLGKKFLRAVRFKKVHEK